MANDKQVKNELIVGSRFLPEEIANIDGGSEVYAFDREFAKTRKNRNWLVFFIICIFVVLIVALSLFVTHYSREKDKQIDVSIQDFEDLRLKEALNSSRLMENNLQIRRNEFQTLMTEMKNKMLEINNKYLIKENDILNQNLPENSKKERIAELERAENAELESVKASYNPKINDLKGFIGELEREINTAERDLARESKNINKVGDEDKVYALKMKSLSESHKNGLVALNDYYERYSDYLILKYNPLINSGQVKTSIDHYSKFSEEKKLREYDDIFAKENIWSRKAYDELRGKIYEQDMLIQRMIGTGYMNSVPPMLISIDNLSNMIVNDYENLWYGLVSKVKDKNSEIEDYKTALDASLKEKPESGYIISVVNTSKISVHINRLITVHEGDTGQVFRTDDQYIGKIEFYKTPEGLKARLVSLAGNTKMRPFDRILIKIK